MKLWLEDRRRKRQTEANHYGPQDPHICVDLENLQLVQPSNMKYNTSEVKAKKFYYLMKILVFQIWTH